MVYQLSVPPHGLTEQSRVGKQKDVCVNKRAVDSL